jgi:hypothetical protein
MSQQLKKYRQCSQEYDSAKYAKSHCRKVAGEQRSTADQYAETKHGWQGRRQPAVLEFSKEKPVPVLIKNQCR